ncbi:MAG: LysM peptidoglycan-binding domain-containing protein [Proteobacteria bacterium]|nr:LysM peptidoglycan-binding domain-containing protein [Pseudomonadota bacterium]
MNPQGSLLEQKSKRKTNLPIIVAIFVAAHLIGAAGILMVGCKPEPRPETKKAPEPVLPPITPPPDAPPVSPAPGTSGGPGTLPPIGGTSGLAPLPTTPPAPVPVPVAPPVPAPSTPPPIAVAPITPPPPVTPPAEPPPAPTGEAKVHVVAKGDSFSTMSKKYGVGVKAIEAANAGVDSTKLKIGQKINIPAAAPKASKAPATTGGAPAPADTDGSYTVKSGDNLGKIAKSHGTTVAKLREANGLKTDQIKVGQKLKMPAGSSSPKKSSEPSASAAPAPKTDVVPVVPPNLPPLGDPASAPTPKL